MEKVCGLSRNHHRQFFDPAMYTILNNQLKANEETWGNTMPADFPNYKPGKWGPELADDLIEKDGRSWIQLILIEFPG